jgi:hypothetical protein
MEWIDASWGLSKEDALVWIRDGSTRGITAGDPVYCGLQSNGYVVCRTSTNPRKTIKAHHLVWYFSRGKWPDSAIDHIDGNRANNSLENLRLATTAQNMANRAANQGRLLPKGVYPHGRKFRAKVGDCYLGLYPTPELARQAAVHHGQLVYGGFFQ